MNNRFPPSDDLAALLADLVAGVLGGESELVIPTGLHDVDETLGGGLRLGQVTLIGGIAGVGTSTFALGLARNAAVRMKLKTLFIAPDSSERELLLRVIAAELRLPVSQLRGGHVDDSDRHKLSGQREELAATPLTIATESPVESTTESLLDSARVGMQRGVRFMVLDGTSRAEPRTRELVKGLKNLAAAHRAAVVVVSKAVLPKHRRTARPALEDLREYEHVADLIDLALMLHREDMHDWDSTRCGEVDLEIIKHRYGPSRRTTAAFQGHYARFVDMAP